MVMPVPALVYVLTSINHEVHTSIRETEAWNYEAIGVDTIVTGSPSFTNISPWCLRWDDHSCGRQSNLPYETHCP
jgi:hypothetical protein